VGIQLKEVEKSKTHRACMILAECPVVLAPESAQPWPIFAQPRHNWSPATRRGELGLETGENGVCEVRRLGRQWW